MTGLQVENTIDLHCHFSPDALGGRALEKGLDLRTGVSPVDSAKEAIASGQTGAVLKSHSFATPALASALGKVFPVSLLLAITGRRAGCDNLTGPGVETLCGRCALTDRVAPSMSRFAKWRAVVRPWACPR
jgi:hypothetical protein